MTASRGNSSEQALHRREERFELAIQCSNAGVWDLEYTIEASSGSVSSRIYISPEFKRFLGYENDEFPSTLEAWRSRVIPEDLEKAIEAAQKALAGSIDAHEVEYRVRHKSGGIRWIHSRGRIRRDEGGRVVRWTGINWDITAHKETEEELKRLVAILEQTPDIISTANLEGKVLYFNRAARDALGVGDVDDLSSLNISRFYPKSALEKLIYKEAVPTALVEGVWRGENVVLNKEGKEIPISQVVLSHTDADGNLQYMSTIARDISLLKEAEAALRESEERYRRLSEKLEAMVKEQSEKLRQAETLAAIGRMTSIIAHEIRNPLSSITLGLDMLNMRLGGHKGSSELFEEIRYGVDILKRLTEELLNYSKPAPLRYSQRAVGALIEDALRRMPPIPSHITICAHVDRPDKEVLLDAEKMVRVLVNLLTNAVDAMPDGGRLQITSTYCESSFGEFVKLCVSDTGAGIDENTLHKICEPFFTTKTRGTGLGLALCRKIIDAHKGSLNIRSKLNEGTTVEIFLPVEPGNHE